MHKIEFGNPVALKHWLECAKPTKMGMIVEFYTIQG